MTRPITFAGVFACAMAFLLIATPAAQAQFNDGIGRYQLTRGSNDEIFMIDTVTGSVWVRYTGRGWRLDGNPVADTQNMEKERAEQRKAEAADQIAKSLKLELPREVVHLTANQRSSTLIEGANHPIYLHLGDITGGRVTLSVFSTNGVMLLDHVTMRPREIASFTAGEDTVYVKLVELKNALLGTDFAEIEISKNRDAIAPQPKDDRRGDPVK